MGCLPSSGRRSLQVSGLANAPVSSGARSGVGFTRFARLTGSLDTHRMTARVETTSWKENKSIHKYAIMSKYQER
jgi:hypothetical protein